MNKFWKTLLAALCLVSLLAVMTGCSKGLVGTWELSGVEGTEDDAAYMQQLEDYGMSFGFVFTETEMTMTTSVAGTVVSTETTTYTLEDGKIVDEDGYAVEYSIKGGKLRLDMDEGIMVFTRK